MELFLYLLIAVGLGLGLSALIFAVCDWLFGNDPLAGLGDFPGSVDKSSEDLI